MPDAIPTAAEFAAACAVEFAFLEDLGFSHERAGEFEHLYVGPPFSVRISGEGYGTVASVNLRLRSGAEIPLVLLVPRASRSSPPPRGQLAQVAFYAQQLQTHCQTELRGDFERLDRAEEEWARITNRGPAA